ncbi:MAG: hypothetical protein JWO84_82 [Parcubacteria group bacterium]|nr:hypothetical protein [Parcubacteria group bacterium]
MSDGNQETRITSYFDSLVDRIREVDPAIFAERYAMDVAVAGTEKVASLIKQSTFIGPAPDNLKRLWVLMASVRDASNVGRARLREIELEAGKLQRNFSNDDPLQIEYDALYAADRSYKEEMSLFQHLLNKEADLAFPGKLKHGCNMFIHPETYQLGYNIPAREREMPGVAIILGGDFAHVFEEGPLTH